MATKKAFMVFVVVALTTASVRLHAQELSELCPDADTEKSAAVVGHVKELDSGAALPNARVMAIWGETESLKSGTGRVGADGSYVLCGLPRDVRLTLFASFLGHGSLAVAVTSTKPVTQQDLGISLSAVREAPLEITNLPEILRLARKYYPRRLRKNREGGTVVLWIYVDKKGHVGGIWVKESSGYAELDEAARRLAARMHFVPAERADSGSGVWIQQPMRFFMQRTESRDPFGGVSVSYYGTVSFSDTTSPLLSARMEEWRQLWSRDAAEQISRAYTDDAILLPPDATPPARGREEIQGFFERFLPTVGDIRTSILEWEVSTTLAYAQGRFFFSGGGQNGDRQEGAINGTYLTVFRREKGKWRIRLQLFKVAKPATPAG